MTKLETASEDSRRTLYNPLYEEQMRSAAPAERLEKRDWGNLPTNCVFGTLQLVFAASQHDPVAERKMRWACAGVCQAWRSVALPLAVDPPPQPAPSSHLPAAQGQTAGEAIPPSLHHVFWHPLQALLPERPLNTGGERVVSTMQRCLVLRTRLPGGLNGFTLHGNADQANGPRCFIMYAFQTSRLRPAYTLSVSQSNPEAGAFASLRADHLSRTHYTLRTLDASTRPWLHRWLTHVGLLPESGQDGTGACTGAAMGSGYEFEAAEDSLHDTYSQSFMAGALDVQRRSSLPGVAAMPMPIPSSRSHSTTRSGITLKPATVCLARMYPTQFGYGSGLPRRLDMQCVHPLRGLTAGQVVKEVLQLQAPAAPSRREASYAAFMADGPSQEAPGALARSASALARHATNFATSIARRASSMSGAGPSRAMAGQVPASASSACTGAGRSSTGATQPGEAAGCTGSSWLRRASSTSGTNKPQASLRTSSGGSVAMISISRFGHHQRCGRGKLGRHTNEGGCQAPVGPGQVGEHGRTSHPGARTSRTSSGGWVQSIKAAVLGTCSASDDGSPHASSGPTDSALSQALADTATEARTSAEHVAAIDTGFMRVVRHSANGAAEDTHVLNHPEPPPMGLPADADIESATPLAVLSAGAVLDDDQEDEDATPMGGEELQPAHPTQAADLVTTRPEEARGAESTEVVPDLEAVCASAVAAYHTSQAGPSGINASAAAGASGSGTGLAVRTGAGSSDTAPVTPRRAYSMPGNVSSNLDPQPAVVAPSSDPVPTTIPSNPTTTTSQPTSFVLPPARSTRSMSQSSSGAAACPSAGRAAAALSPLATRLSSISEPGSQAATPAQEQSSPPMVKFNSKQPHWNTNMRCWCLNFGGRVRLPSARNFQLCMPESTAADHDPLRVVLQFGKVGQDAFCLDWDLALMSPAQALAAALTTFHRSWGMT